jgi:hypothetical protein
MRGLRGRAAFGAAIVVCILLALGARAGAAPSARQAPPLNGINFISVCGFSHRGNDDPIVYPDRPGISHDHSFVGNVSTDASSTLTTLRAAKTTCQRPGDTAAYWAPTLLVAGTPVPPLDAIVYYRRLTDAKLKPFPAGLKMVAGDSHAFTPQSLLVTYWDCGAVGETPRGNKIPDCGAQNLRLTVNFPDCWNGKRLDSIDHKRHMAYSRNGRCPPGHKVAVPAIQLVYRYALPPVEKLSDVYLASGSPFSAHADFINAWNQAALTKLVTSCLNQYRHCGTGSPSARRA